MASAQHLTSEQSAVLDETVAASSAHDKARSGVTWAEWQLKLASSNDREVMRVQLDQAKGNLKVRFGERNRAIRAAATAGCETKTLVDALLYAPAMIDRILAKRGTAK